MKNLWKAKMAAPKVFQFKLVLLGDSAVGKSSLVLRFVRGQFFEYQEATIGGNPKFPSDYTGTPCKVGAPRVGGRALAPACQTHAQGSARGCAGGGEGGVFFAWGSSLTYRSLSQPHS